MRVLVSSFPGKGHFHPVAPFALELASQGHEVVVATGGDLVEWVRACGLAARPAGLSEHDAVQRAEREVPPGAPFGPYMFARVAAEATLPDLRQIAIDWPPDLVVHEEAEFAAPLLAAELGLPCVTHSWPAPSMPVDARVRATRWLEPLWEAAGRGSARTVGDLYLDSCPPSLQTRDITAVSNVQPVRPALFDGPPSTTMHGLDQLPHPLAYVTLGTVAAFARAATLTMIAAAAAEAAAAVLVTTGPVAPDTLGPLPANVFVEPWVPQRQALEHADLLISHGGAGSVLGGLLHGLPHLVLPQGAPSQQRCADQLTRLGAGTTLPPDEQTPANLRHAIETLLAATSHRRSARQVADELQRLPDVATVANILTSRFTAQH